MEELKDPLCATVRCGFCVIHQAEEPNDVIDQHERYWQENGGEPAREQFYNECEDQHAL